MTARTNPKYREPIEPLAVSVKEAERLIGAKTTTIYKLMADGTLARRKVGRRTVVLYASIKRLLQIQDAS